MIRRLAVPAAVLGAVLAFYIIAPDGGTDEENRAGAFAMNLGVSVANIRAWQLGDTLRALNSALQRATAWETARAVAPDPAATKVITLPGFAANKVRAFQQDAQTELQALGVPRVPIRVVLAPDSQLVGRYRKIVVIPQVEGQPCVVVVTVSTRGREDGAFPDDRLLGACGFYAKFGRAGSGMRAWLESTRGLAAAVDTVLTELGPARSRRKLTGAVVGEAPAAAACLAGDDDGCAKAVMDPLGIRSTRPIVPPSERTAGVFISSINASRYGPGVMLAELREHVGDERFAQIWTSSEDPAAAFQTATGEHIAVFARPMLLREALPHRPGPLRADFSLLFGLSIGVTAAVIAITRTRRERSGA